MILKYVKLIQTWFESDFDSFLFLFRRFWASRREALGWLYVARVGNLFQTQRWRLKRQIPSYWKTERYRSLLPYLYTYIYILIYYMILINVFLQISLLSKKNTARVRDSTPRPVLFLSLSIFCWIYVGIQNVSTQAKAAFTCQQLSCHKTQASAVVEGLGVQTGLQWIATRGSLSNYANLCLIYT